MPLDGVSRGAARRGRDRVSGGWRYGPVLDDAHEPPGDPHGLRRLAARARLRACFERGIRVLSAAPGFAGAVAEMALGLALASQPRHRRR